MHKSDNTIPNNSVYVSIPDESSIAQSMIWIQKEFRMKCIYWLIKPNTL